MKPLPVVLSASFSGLAAAAWHPPAFLTRRKAIERTVASCVVVLTGRVPPGSAAAAEAVVAPVVGGAVPPIRGVAVRNGPRAGETVVGNIDGMIDLDQNLDDASSDASTSSLDYSDGKLNINKDDDSSLSSGSDSDDDDNNNDNDESLESREI